MVALPIDETPGEGDVTASNEAAMAPSEAAIATVPIDRPAPTPAAPAPARAARPTLVVVQRRRSWTALLVGGLSVLIFGGMLGAAVFHTQLAGRQLRIDRLERAVTQERERFDELRHRRAELRSPAYLDTVADDFSMIRGKTGTFLRVSPQRLAMQLAAAGTVEGGSAEIVADVDPLDQFRDVKAVSEGQP
jgi:predicted lipid-binding transport protein (Tim44 family)